MWSWQLFNTTLSTGPAGGYYQLDAFYSLWNQNIFVNGVFIVQINKERSVTLLPCCSAGFYYCEYQLFSSIAAVTLVATVGDLDQRWSELIQVCRLWILDCNTYFHGCSLLLSLKVLILMQGCGEQRVPVSHRHHSVTVKNVLISSSRVLWKLL